METWHIALIACGGVLIVFILTILLIRKSNRKRFKKLQENLKKYQQENEDFGKDGDPDVMKGVSVSEENTKFDAGVPIIEDYVPEKPQNTEKETAQSEPIKMPEHDDFDFDSFLEKESPKEKARRKHDEEFESFMNEHAFSRRVLDKNMVDKIKNLPPDIKAIILNSVFDKFDNK